MHTYAHVHIQYSIFIVGKQKEMSKFLTFTRVSLPNSLPSHTLTIPSEIILNSEGVNVYNENGFVQCKVAKKKLRHANLKEMIYLHMTFSNLFIHLYTHCCAHESCHICAHHSASLPKLILSFYHVSPRG